MTKGHMFTTPILSSYFFRSLYTFVIFFFSLPICACVLLSLFLSINLIASDFDFKKKFVLLFCPHPTRIKPTRLPYYQYITSMHIRRTPMDRFNTLYYNATTQVCSQRHVTQTHPNRYICPGYASIQTEPKKSARERNKENFSFLPRAKGKTKRRRKQMTTTRDDG